MATEANNEAVNEVDQRTKPAFLQRVRIRGYKSIAYCDVRLEPLTLLVGRNAAGKSNFLDALAFVRDALATNIPEATKRHGGWHAMLSRFSASGEISLEVELSLPSLSLATAAAAPSAKYGFVLKVGPVPESPVLAREWFESPVANGVGGCHYDLTGAYDPGQKKMNYTWKFHHPEIACSQVPYPRTDGLWIGAFGKEPFREMAAGLRSMAFYDFIPQAMRPPQPPAPGQLLDQTGWNLASVIDATGKNERRVLDRVSRYLAVITGSVELLGMVRYGDKVGDFETVRFRVKRNGYGEPLEFVAAQMSDGTLRAVAALLAAFQVVPPYGFPSVVAIEEPEAALHPAATRALVDALDEATPRTQILLTTHSAEMLDNPTIRPANVRVVQLIEGQTVIGPVDQANVEVVRRELNTLGGLEREDQLEPDLEDQRRQRHLAQEQGTAP